MAVDVNMPDKVFDGVHFACTITSDEGLPAAQVAIEGAQIASRVVPLGPPKDAAESTTPVMKYKLTFLVPEETAGKTLRLALQAGGSRVEEESEIVAG